MGHTGIKSVTPHFIYLFSDLPENEYELIKDKTHYKEEWL
jgi:hypothetical protein